MKPREWRETGEVDLFRSRLDQIINMNHELMQLAKTVSWEAIEARCGGVYFDRPGFGKLRPLASGGRKSADACTAARLSA